LGAHRVLDLGCGNGAITASLSQAGFDVVGCDPSEEGIVVARRAFSRLPFHVLSVYDEPSRLGASDFDVVVSTEVIEHLFLPRFLPRFASRVLRQSGYLILSTPYHGYAKNLALSVTGKWDDHHSPCWDGGHVKFWSRRTLTALVAEEGFQFIQFIGAGRLPYLWKSMIVIFQKQ
jgi:2-polyprenyl-3-methyl-5-hydroxy-6-metoxy-1,4-benzoquinol methylase